MPLNEKDRMHNWKLSPSDFAFLYEESKRCFYLKVARDYQRPRGPFPKIFTIIDGLMKDYFEGKRTSELDGEYHLHSSSLGEFFLSMAGQVEETIIRATYQRVWVIEHCEICPNPTRP